MLPSVYVVVLNWNHLEDLVMTMDSLKQQDYSNLSLIVSDNGSTDGSVAYIRDNYPDAILLDNKANLGWAAGNNVGIEFALKQHADFVLLSNNDIYIEDVTLISTLVHDFETLNFANVGIMGTKQFYFYPKEKMRTDGWVLYEDAINNGRCFNPFRRDFKFELDSKYKVSDFVTGSFMLIKSELFHKIGLIDDVFFMYSEEAEFSYRAWKAGYASLVNRNVNMYHKVAASSGEGSPFSLYYQTRNRLYFFNKHKDDIPDYHFFRKQYIRGWVRHLFVNFFKLILDPSLYNGLAWRRYRAKFRGFVDGLLGKMGARF